MADDSSVPALAVSYTEFTNCRGRLSKGIAPNGNEFHKIGTTCLFDGSAERIRLAGNGAEEVLRSLGDRLERLPSNQAIALGVFTDPTLNAVQITTQRQPRNDAIPRDRKHFIYPSGPGLICLDGDYVSGLRDTLIAIYPPFAGVATLARSSASAGV